jgi:hypothetical protein
MGITGLWWGFRNPEITHGRGGRLNGAWCMEDISGQGKMETCSSMEYITLPSPWKGSERIPDHPSYNHTNISFQFFSPRRIRI